MSNKFHRPQGGCETVYFSEIEGLKKKGFEVAEFSMRESNMSHSDFSSFFADEVRYDGIGIKDKAISASKAIYNFNAKSQLDELIDQFEPDIFHAHNIYHQISPSIFSSTQKHDIPTIMTSHDLKLACPNYKMYVNGNACSKCLGGKFWNCAINRCSKGNFAQSMINTVEAYTHKALGLYKQIDRIICPSRFNAEMLIRAGYSEESISILPNGINLDALPEPADKEGFILYVGRLTYDKGVGSIIQAASKMPHVEFKIVGDGPDKDLFEQQAQGLKNVHFLGFKKREEVDLLISRCSGVIVSSLLYENCPMSVLETMSQGKAVIASDIGGIPEIVKHGVNGFLYRNEDISSLCESIEFVVDGGERINSIELQARADIETRYSEAAHLEGLISIYQETAK
ncbi:glycosyltransferase family 4 protein [Vibrio sp. TBV020]|uniref:glycosyltransferase family 4 protein n=1 Tax=Vibrio sp. TBV020 TaxID=3137398 RepID=UPI0038CD7EDD